MEQPEDLTSFPPFFYTGQRVEITCDLTRYYSPLIIGSQGTISNGLSARGDHFALVLFDSHIRNMDILWQSLKPVMNEDYKGRCREKIAKHKKRKRCKIETAENITVMYEIKGQFVQLDYDHKIEGKSGMEHTTIIYPLKIIDRMKIFEELGKTITKIPATRNITGSRYFGYIRTYFDKIGMGKSGQKTQISSWAITHQIKAKSIDYYEDANVERNYQCFKSFRSLISSLQKGDVILVADTDMLIFDEDNNSFNVILKKGADLYIIDNRLALSNRKFYKRWQKMRRN